MGSASPRTAIFCLKKAKNTQSLYRAPYLRQNSVIQSFWMSSYVLATYFSQKLCIYNYRSTSDIFLYICTLIQLAAAARLSVQVNKLYIFVRSLGYCPLKQFIAIFMNYF